MEPRLDCAKLAGSSGAGGSRSTATRVTRGAISLSSSSHFAAYTVLEVCKPSNIAARPREAVNEARADRVDDESTNTIGMVRVARCNASRDGAVLARMTSGASATSSPHICDLSSVCWPPQRIVDPQVTAHGPAVFLHRLREGAARSVCLADHPRATFMSTPTRRILALLRPRRERPRHRRAAEQRDELAARAVAVGTRVS